MTYISSEKMAGVFIKTGSDSKPFTHIDKSWEQRRTGDGSGGGNGNENVKGNEPNK